MSEPSADKADLASRLNEVELWIDRVSYVKGAEAMYAPLRQRRNYLRGRITELRTPPGPPTPNGDA